MSFFSEVCAPSMKLDMLIFGTPSIELVRICKDLKDLQGFVRICNDLHGFVNIFKDSQGCERSRKDLQGFQGFGGSFKVLQGFVN